MAVTSTGIVRNKEGAKGWLYFGRHACSLVIIVLLLCAAIGSAFADDDEGPPRPPDANSVAAAGQMTIAVLALVVGVAVYYGVQRYSLLNSAQHPQEWQTKMTRNAIILAVLSTVVVWGVCAALSRPPKRGPTATAAAAHAP